jgi:phage terminase small subunit
MRAYENLTPRHQRFVEAFLADKEQNATAAYIAAGYKARGHAAETNAWRLLRNAEVQAALAERRAQLADTNAVTPERVIAELALIGFSDLHAYVTWGPGGVTLRDSAQIDAAARRVVSEVSQTITQGGGSIRFKLHSKTDALDKLARHLDLYGDKAALEQLGQGLMGLMAQARKTATNGQHTARE